LGEGATPLIGLGNIPGKPLVKFEGLNPTGSFKDRGMTVGISIALDHGARRVIVASTGNTAASAAAYSARAGLGCVVIVPRDGVARGKLGQSMLHGASVVELVGGFDEALEFVIEVALGDLDGLYPLNSFNPWRLEGQKTLAYEVFEEVGIPDSVVVPVGNGGNIYAIWKGFRELVELGIADHAPRMIGVQASGASPLVRAWRGLGEPVVSKPTTVASAIRIGRPVNWSRALRAVRDSGGLFLSVTDEEIIRAQRLMAKGGVGVEPASAASLAGYLRLLEMGELRGESVVLVGTGHALKDPDLLASSGKPLVASSLEDLKALVARGEV
jgi:threonine synthase